MNTVERFSTWQLVGIGLAAWVVYAWFINPVWAEYRFFQEHLGWFVVHAALAVGFLIWRGWSKPKPVPVEESEDAA